MRPLVLLLLLSGCAPGSGPSPESPAPEPPPNEPSAAVPAPLPAAPVALTERRYAATHVLIAWKGAAKAGPSVTRTQAQARQIAQQVWERAGSGESLEDLARQLSDDSSGPRGGSLGVYARGTMVPAFEQAVASVQPGELAPLVETPFGVHVVRRDAVIEAHLAHIQFSWAGTYGATTRRTEDEALERLDAARKALDAGAPFDEVARQYSDDPSAAVNGGDLGIVAPGQLVPAFETAAFALAPGDRSEPVRTPYGVHLIERRTP